MPDILLTSERLLGLEQNESIKAICKAIKQEKKDFGDLEYQGLNLIYKALIKKAEEAISPISQAKYSSIFIYNVDSNISIHSGANIDPVSKENLGLVEYRNCAEKQAALSGAMNDFGLIELDLIFLYRKPESNKFFSPEKYVPCLQCRTNYLLNLIKNNGHLIIFLPDSEERDFFLETNFQISAQILQSVIHDNQINYVIFNPEQIHFLRFEENLGKSNI